MTASRNAASSTPSTTKPSGAPRKGAGQKKPQGVTAEQFTLLRQVIMAKVVYWDALRALELATTSEGEWVDHVNDAFIEAIDNIAACCDTPIDSAVVTEEDLTEAFGRLITKSMKS